MSSNIKLPILGRVILSSCSRCEYQTHAPTPLPLTPKFSSGRDSGCDVLSLNLTAVAGPALVPLTLNFTITNLHYVKDMQFPGSVKFSKIEKILQHLVRLLPCPPMPAMPTSVSHPTSPVPYACVSASQLIPAPHLIPAQPLSFPTGPSTHFLLLLQQLRALFKNTSVNLLYSSCRLTLLR